MGYHAFNGVASTCVLTVPYGTHDAYIAAGWTTSTFKGGIVEMVSKSIDMSANGISTFCCDYDLDFSGVSGLKAYIVSGFSPSTGVTTTTNISPTDGNQTNFILANGSHGIGFYTIDATGPLAAGKAYLHLPTTAVSALARCFIFDFENEEASGIVELEAEAAEADGCFDLQGRHVLRPSNGIYIVNGKKVFIK